MESMDLGSGMCLDKVGKFCYLGDMLSERANSESLARVPCIWESFENCQIPGQGRMCH